MYVVPSQFMIFETRPSVFEYPPICLRCIVLSDSHHVKPSEGMLTKYQVRVAVMMMSLIPSPRSHRMMICYIVRQRRKSSYIGQKWSVP